MRHTRLVVQAEMYYMTVTHHSTRGTWEACRAQTLRGALREATARYGAGYLDHTIVVGDAPRHDDNGHPDIRPLRSRLVRNDSWTVCND